MKAFCFAQVAALPLVAGVWLAACAGASPVRPSTEPSAAVSATASPSALSALASPPAASGSASVAPAVPKTDVSSPFHAAADTNAALQLRPLQGKLLVQYGEGFARVESGKLEVDAELSRGLPTGMAGLTVGVYGHWPDSAWASVVIATGRSGIPGISKWDHHQWKPLGNTDLPFMASYVGLSEYQDGSMLALAYEPLAMGAAQLRFKTVGGSARAPAFRFEKATVQPENCQLALVPLVMRSFASGHALVAGSRCGDDKPSFQYWSPGQTSGRLEVIEDAGKVTQDGGYVAARGAEDIWIAWAQETGTRLVHFDGKVITRVETPAGLKVQALDVTPEGVLWMVAGGKVFKAGVGASLQEVPLPSADGKSAGADGLAVAPDGAVWVTAGSALLTTSAGFSTLAHLAWEEGQAQRGSVALPRAATWQCRDIFVLMYGVTRVTPPGYDYPLTRKALKGHTEFAGVRLVETEDGGKRYIGAFVADLDLARRMARLVAKEVKGSTPEVLCVKPKVVREMQIDWRSGNVISNGPPAP